MFVSTVATGSCFRSFRVACVMGLASLVAQLVKNLPAVQETPVRFLGQEDLLEEG